MALSAVERQAAAELKSQGYTTTQIMGFIGGQRMGKRSTVATQLSQPEAQPGRFADAGEDLATGAKQFAGDMRQIKSNVWDNINAAKAGEQSIPETVANVGLGIAGGTFGALVGRGIQTASKLFMKPSEETAVGDAVAGLVEKTGINATIENVPDRSRRAFQGAIDGLNLIGIGAAKSPLQNATKQTLSIGPRITKDVSATLREVGDVGANGISRSLDIGISPESLMQRVARVSKGKQAKFEERAKQSVGEYLVDRGIFGDPEAITDQLYSRMKQSKGRVDTGLAQVGGTYKDGSVEDALTLLREREAKVSTPNTPSPDQRRVAELIAKHKGEGLTLSEINEVKRLFERNVKLDYLRDNVADGIARANNIDAKLRDFVEVKADQGGFKTVKALNRETYLAKQLLDDLGAEYAGQQGNNLISLSDAFFLAEAASNPTALAAFGLKKTLSSKGAMSAVAQLMARGRKTQDMPSGDVTGFRALPAPGQSSATMPAGNPLNVGARTQSTVDAAEMANPAIKAPEVSDAAPSFGRQAVDAQKEASEQIRTEMYDLAETGLKPVEDGKYIRWSSFPKWIEKESGLRRTDLFNRVWAHIDNGTKPRANATDEIELMGIVEEQIKRRADELSTPDTSLSNGSDMAFGGLAGVQVDDEGNLTLNPYSAAFGVAGMAAAKKLTPDLKNTISKELEKYDTEPITLVVKGRKLIDTSASDADFRLAQLQDKLANGKFTNTDALEAQALLQKVGIDVTSGNIPQSSSIQKKSNVDGWTGTPSSKQSTAGDTSISKEPTDTAAGSKPSTAMSGGGKGEYLYHGTGGINLEVITKEGLKPGRRGFLSLSKDQAYSEGYVSSGWDRTPDGQMVQKHGGLLRVRADYVKGKTTLPKKTAPMSDQLNELLTKEHIPPEAIEILKDGKWQPLKPSPLTAEARKSGGFGDEAAPKKYKTTVNLQDKDDLEYLGRILSQDAIADIKAGKTTNWRGESYEDLARVNIISEKPLTVAQKLEGKIKPYTPKSATFYHGTSEEAARSILKSGFKAGASLPKDAFRGGGYDRMQNTISLAETPKEASIFSSLTKNGKVIEVKLKNDAKIVSIEGIEDAADLEDYVAYLKQQKIDAVYIGGGEKELVVVNPKAILSQTIVRQ